MNFKEKIYDDLGLHSLTVRRPRSKLVFFYKILNGFGLLFSRELSPKISNSLQNKTYPVKDKIF